MPTIGGVLVNTDAAPGYIGALHPPDWLSDHMGGIMQGAVKRGHPVALDYTQRCRQTGPGTIAQGRPFWLHSRPYSRGAPAYSPKFGVVNINPIGAGIYAPYKLPVIAGPGARYKAAAIWFDVQAIPTSLRMGPTQPIETVNALIATSRVSAMYPTTG